ncbi:MAG: FadR family transcriptional regulator [Thermomicrobiales bacterium]|nr:FadR family transcriptional regulator [Thermomicrobiales bacterium]
MSDDLTIEPVNRSRLSQRIVLRICELIRDNRLSAGDRLPPERELAERLQVSRASLREALTALELAGIVETRHGDGTRVRDFHELGVTSPLALTLSATDDLVGDLWELRIIFEPALAAQAALRANDDDVAAMRAANDDIGRLASHRESAERTIYLDREFHAAVARASGNRAAVRVLQLLNELLLSSRRHFAAEPNRRHRTFTRHNEIISAIERRDPPAARDSMLRHLQDVELYIVGSVLEEHLDEPPEAGAGSSDAARIRKVDGQKGGGGGAA